jgi:hypothetical protein
MTGAAESGLSRHSLSLRHSPFRPAYHIAAKLLTGSPSSYYPAVYLGSIMASKSRAWRYGLLMTLILGGALGVRLAGAAWWEARLPAGERFGFGDSESYWVLAGAIARGGPYEYGEGGARVFRTPGYPLLLAPLFLVYDGKPPTMSARVLNAVWESARWRPWRGWRGFASMRARRWWRRAGGDLSRRRGDERLCLERGALLPADAAPVDRLEQSVEDGVEGGRSTRCFALVAGRGSGRRRGDAGPAELAAVHAVCAGDRDRRFARASPPCAARRGDAAGFRGDDGPVVGAELRGGRPLRPHIAASGRQSLRWAFAPRRRRQRHAARRSVAAGVSRSVSRRTEAEPGET